MSDKPTRFSELNNKDPKKYADLPYWRKDMIRMFENRLTELEEAYKTAKGVEARSLCQGMIPVLLLRFVTACLLCK